MNTSKFHLYSQGIAAADADGMKLKVTPIELVQYYDGDIAHSEERIEHVGEDAAGKQYSVAVKTTTAIEAEWLHSTNRGTAPNVVLGERVMIYQYADENKFYWECFGQDDGYRQLETVEYYYANKQDRKKKTNDLTNAYQVKVSTKDKIISIITNKSDSEPYAYQILLDTKKGNFTIKDDVGNEIMLDSPAEHLRLKNKSGSMLEMIKNVINQKAAESINLETKTYNVKATTGNLNVDTVNVKGKTVSIKGSDMSIDGSSLGIKSATTFTGSSVKHLGKEIGKLHTHGTPATTGPVT